MKTQTAIMIGLVFLFSTKAQAQPPQQLLETGIAQLVTNPNQAKKLIRMAKTALQEQLQKEPDNAYIHFLLGQTHFYLKQGQPALDSYSKAIKLDPSKAYYRFMHGIALRLAKKNREALDELSHAANLAPTVEKYWYELGNTYFQNGDYEQALTHFKRAISLNPSYDSALFKAGVIFANQNQPDLAIQYWNMTVRANPKQIAAHNDLAHAYEAAGQDYQAIYHFRKVVELNQKDWQARTKLVQLYQATDQSKMRDAQRAALLALRTSNTIPSLSRAKNYCRDQFSIEDNKVFAIEYFDMITDTTKRYAFKVMNKYNSSFLYEIILGSNQSNNNIALEQGIIKQGERLFQLDRVDLDGKRQAYAFYKQEPTYDQIKAIVIDIILGKRKPN